MNNAAPEVAVKRAQDVMRTRDAGGATGRQRLPERDTPAMSPDPAPTPKMVSRAG